MNIEIYKYHRKEKMNEGSRIERGHVTKIRVNMYANYK